MLSVHACLLLALSAQSGSEPRFQRYTGPALRTARLDLATGTVTRGPATRARAATTVADFSNLDLSGFVGLDSGNCASEWFSAGIKGSGGNASDLMSEIVFAYCSEMLAVGQGGPGGSTKLGFYEGYTVGGGSPTTAVAVFTLTGLPASTFCGFAGTITGCFYLTVSFSPLICFADGPIGYSWKFRDPRGFCQLLGSTATYPFLSCVQSCSGPGPDLLGMVDLIDRYAPPGTLSSTFSFGTIPYGSFFTSIAMEIREAADVLASAAPHAGDLENEDALAASPAILGKTWSAVVTSVNGHGSGGPISVKVRSATINGPSFPSPVGGRLNEVLIGGPPLATLTGTHDGVSGSVSVALPKRLALLCVPWAAQATILGGGFADLTTAVAGISGTQ